MLMLLYALHRQITKDALGVLMSDELIAVNQDPLGVPGDLIWKQGSDEVRPLAARSLPPAQKTPVTA